VGENGRRDARGEAIGGALVGVEFDLEEAEALDGALAGEAGGEAEEMGADDELGAQARQQRNHHLEDLSAFERVGAGAELVEQREGVESRAA
jgi:hypothetical protein